MTDEQTAQGNDKHTYTVRFKARISHVDVVVTASTRLEAVACARRKLEQERLPAEWDVETCVHEPPEDLLGRLTRSFPDRLES